MDSLEEENISNITALNYSEYAYSCQLEMGNDSPLFIALNKVFEKLEMGVSFKGIELADNTSTLDFNIKDGKLEDFHIAFKLQIGVNAAKVILDVDYSQKGIATAIELPNISGLMYSSTAVREEINYINSTLDALKNDAVYSLDLTAKNELDPGWSKLAVVDSYSARMYKKTVENIDWFNHSYCFRAHGETLGNEAYKYTLGNVNGTDEDNRGVWLISRKSNNTQTKVENVSAETQFDFLTSAVKQQAEEIDCIKKQVDGDNITYTIYLGKAATKSVQEKIVGMINTNSYDDALPVDNYFNTENVIKDASIEVVIKEGKVSSVVCKTELSYNPLGGDYTEYNVTLNNTIELLVNTNLTNAQNYEIPDRVRGNLIGWGNNLNDREYYIL